MLSAGGIIITSSLLNVAQDLCQIKIKDSYYPLFMCYLSMVFLIGCSVT